MRCGHCNTLADSVMSNEDTEEVDTRATNTHAEYGWKMFNAWQREVFTGLASAQEIKTGEDHVSCFTFY